MSLFSSPIKEKKTSILSKRVISKTDIFKVNQPQAKTIDNPENNISRIIDSIKEIKALLINHQQTIKILVKNPKDSNKNQKKICMTDRSSSNDKISIFSKEVDEMAIKATKLKIEKKILKELPSDTKLNEESQKRKESYLKFFQICEQNANEILKILPLKKKHKLKFSIDLSGISKKEGSGEYDMYQKYYSNTPESKSKVVISPSLSERKFGVIRKKKNSLFIMSHSSNLDNDSTSLNEENISERVLTETNIKKKSIHQIINENKIPKRKFDLKNKSKEKINKNCEEPCKKCLLF